MIKRLMTVIGEALSVKSKKGDGEEAWVLEVKYEGVGKRMGNGNGETKW